MGPGGGRPWVAAGGPQSLPAAFLLHAGRVDPLTRSHHSAFLLQHSQRILDSKAPFWTHPPCCFGFCCLKPAGVREVSEQAAAWHLEAEHFTFWKRLLSPLCTVEISPENVPSWVTGVGTVWSQSRVGAGTGHSQPLLLHLTSAASGRRSWTWPWPV